MEWVKSSDSKQKIEVEAENESGLYHAEVAALPSGFWYSGLFELYNWGVSPTLEYTRPTSQLGTPTGLSWGGMADGGGIYVHWDDVSGMAGSAFSFYYVEFFTLSLELRLGAVSFFHNPDANFSPVVWISIFSIATFFSRYVP